MATNPTSQVFNPRETWAKSIDFVVLDIRLQKLRVNEMKKLKQFREEREFWQRWRRAQKASKEKKYLEERKQKQQRRRLAIEEECERAAAKRRETSKVKEKQIRWEDDERGAGGCRLRSMDRSRTEDAGGGRRLRRMNSVDNFH